MLDTIRRAATIFRPLMTEETLKSSTSSRDTQNIPLHGTTREHKKSFSFLPCRKALRGTLPFPEDSTFRDIRRAIRHERRMADKQVVFVDETCRELLAQMRENPDVLRVVFLNSPYMPDDGRNDRRVLALSSEGEMEAIPFSGVPLDGDYIVLRRDRKKAA